MLLALIAWAYPNSGSTDSSAKPVPAARVPTVTGLSSQAAIRRVSAVGLAPVNRWCGAQAGQYTVVRQRPAGGTVVPRGTKVRMVLAPATGKRVAQPACNAVAGPKP
jgi:beta-lactam-binding protein with PASTA domain